MTDEQLERAMNFILDQQAKTDSVMQDWGYRHAEIVAILQQITETNLESSKKHAETESMLQRLTEKNSDSEQRHANHEAMLRQLTEKNSDSEQRHTNHEAAFSRIDANLEKVSQNLAILTADAVTTDHELINHSDEIYALVKQTEAQTEAINRLIDFSDRSKEEHERWKDRNKEWEKRHEHQDRQHEEWREHSEKMMDQLAERLNQLTDLVQTQFKTNRNGDSST
ncbi:MAG: hypothetical protein ACRD82_10185 [Blastocatellia bacterium]